MVNTKVCTSCKKRLGDGSTSFKCPKCKKETIRRCFHCRELASKYICPNCKLEGPN